MMRRVVIPFLSQDIAVWCLCLLLSIVYSPLALADSSAAPSVAMDPMSGGHLLRVFGGLLLVLALAVGVIWLLKKVQCLPSRTAGEIKLIGALSLGQRERVVVLQLGEEQLLLGVSAGRINTLHVLQSPLSSPENASDQRSIASENSRSFQEKLKDAIKRQGGHEEP